jgi:hypothetical protein
MISAEQFKFLIPLACEWVELQEKRILSNGVELNADQQIDAYLVGVKNPTKVRLLKVDKIPLTSFPTLKKLSKKQVCFHGLLSELLIDMVFTFELIAGIKGS